MSKKRCEARSGITGSQCVKNEGHGIAHQWADAIEDPRMTSKKEKMAYLEHRLLATLIEMRDLDPRNYLVRLMCDAINGKLKPVPLSQQRELPLMLRKQAE